MGKWYQGTLSSLFSNCLVEEIVNLGQSVESGGSDAALSAIRDAVRKDRSRTPCFVLGMEGDNPQDDLWRLMPADDQYYLQGVRDGGILVQNPTQLLLMAAQDNESDISKLGASFRCLYPADINQKLSPAAFSMLALKKYKVPASYQILAWDEQPLIEGQLQVKFEAGKISLRFIRVDETTGERRQEEYALNTNPGNTSYMPFLSELKSLEDIQGNPFYQNRFLLELRALRLPLALREMKNQVVIAHLSNLDKPPSEVRCSLYLSDELAGYFAYRTDELVQVTDVDTLSFFNALLKDKLNNEDLAIILAPLFNRGEVDMAYYQLLLSVESHFKVSDFAALFREYAGLYKVFSDFSEDSEVGQRLQELANYFKQAVKKPYSVYKIEFRDSDLPYIDGSSKALKNIDDQKLNMETMYVYPSEGQYYIVFCTHEAKLVRVSLTVEEYWALKGMSAEEQFDWAGNKAGWSGVREARPREPFEQALAQLKEKMREVSNLVTVKQYRGLSEKLTALEEASQTYPENSGAREEANKVIAELAAILASYRSVDGLTDKNISEKQDLQKDYAEQFEAKLWVATPSLDNYTAYFCAYPQLKRLLQDLEGLAGSFAEGSIPAGLAKPLIASVKQKLTEYEGYHGLNEVSSHEDYERKGQEYLAFYQQNLARKGILDCYREIASLDKLYETHKKASAAFTPQSTQARHAQSALADLARDIQDYYRAAQALGSSIEPQAVQAFVDVCAVTRRQFEMQLAKLKQYQTYQDKLEELIDQAQDLKAKSEQLPELTTAGKIMRQLANFLADNVQRYQDCYAAWPETRDQDTLAKLDFYFQQSQAALAGMAAELKVFDQYRAMGENLREFEEDTKGLAEPAKAFAEKCIQRLTGQLDALRDQSYVQYKINAIDSKTRPELEGVFYRNQIFFTIADNQYELYIYDDYSNLHRLTLPVSEFGETGTETFTKQALLARVYQALPELRQEMNRDKFLQARGVVIEGFKAEISRAKEGLTAYPRLQGILDKIKALLDSVRKISPKLAPLADSLAKSSLFAKPKPVDDLTEIEQGLNRFNR